MIDLHSHVLPALDDGCRTIEESVELARSLVAGGVRVLAATPHVREDFPTKPKEMLAGVTLVQIALDDAGVDLAVVSGGELGFDYVDRLDPDTVRAFTIGGGGQFVILEFPDDDLPGRLADRVAYLQGLGLDVILAHPERNPVVQAAPQRLAGLVDAGALIQVTAGSLTGAFGSAAAMTARSLLDSGLVQLVAGDSHRPGGRPAVADAMASVPRRLVTWLTHDAPAAILEGSRPPAPPATGRRRFFARSR